ncbi:MAG: peptide chain release factor N(5)-glutamine methyltransferase [Alphaproteobacteria bacterium]|nr:MAG: peptide chain release factor N(5)-glutamine methyltransferase [Alphaproteobacteria bacterium]
MKRRALLAEATARLAAAGIADAAREARILLRRASGLGAGLAAALDDPAGPAEVARLRADVAERARRRPMAQILGEREFWGRRFRVTADVLDPRPDTETLIEAALALGPRRRLLDLGTGSGAILLTLLAEWPGATALGIDASAAALAVARDNARRLGVADRARLRQGDWLDGVAGRFDLILCNPPYIPEAELAALEPEVRDWEPRIALTPGGDGLEVYRRLAPRLAAHLQPGGAALFEIGRGQDRAVAGILAAAGLARIAFRNDLNGVPRCVIVQP